MTKIKFCGLSRLCDVDWANVLEVDYIGFVFAPQSRRYITDRQAKQLKSRLNPDITAVGVFVDEKPEIIANLLKKNIIEAVQLHGNEDKCYIEKLHHLVKAPIIKTFCIHKADDILEAEQSNADYILFDTGAGTGKTFDWDLIKKVTRPYFLAGGLNVENVNEAVDKLLPWAVDVSSGIETSGKKDKEKMTAFVNAVREGRRL